MKETLEYIAIKDIFQSLTPLRPVRKNHVEYAELVESIRTDGILQSLLLRPHDDKYEVVEGNHRFAAATEANLEKVPCIVRNMTNSEVAIVQLKCNAVKPVETMDIEYARRLRKLLQEGETIQTLSAKIDKNPVWIRKVLRLNALCDKAKIKVSNGAIKITSAMALATLPQHLQVDFIDEAIEMKSVPFCERVRKARADLETFLLEKRREDILYGARPQMRPSRQIIEESAQFQQAPEVLNACKAETPIQGWKACLAWIMSVDPITIMEKRKGIKKEANKKLSNYQWRMKQREMIKNLTFPKITGEYK